MVFSQMWLLLVFCSVVSISCVVLLLDVLYSRTLPQTCKIPLPIKPLTSQKKKKKKKDQFLIKGKNI